MLGMACVEGGIIVGLVNLAGYVLVRQHAASGKSAQNRATGTIGGVCAIFKAS